MYNNFVERASCIKGFIVGQKEDVPYDITDLANNYCDAQDRGDEILRDAYISALMIRYWHMISIMYKKTEQFDIDAGTCLEWLYDSFAKAFKYKSWRDPNKAISKDKKGAEKCFNQCITSTVANKIKYFNQEKRHQESMKTPFFITSLDESIEKNGDYAEGLQIEDDYLQTQTNF